MEIDLEYDNSKIEFGDVIVTDKGHFYIALYNDYDCEFDYIICDIQTFKIKSCENYHKSLSESIKNAITIYYDEQIVSVIPHEKLKLTTI